MSDALPERNIMQQEEVKADAAVSEATGSRIAGNINFVNLRHCFVHEFNLNGSYNRKNVPGRLGDGVLTYPWPFEIVDVVVVNPPILGGLIGTPTEIDLLWAAEASGTFATIFSTTPKINGNAPDWGLVRVGGAAPTGMTAPVLSKTTFNAYDKVRCNMVTKLVANHTTGVFVRVFTRPRN